MLITLDWQIYPSILIFLYSIFIDILQRTRLSRATRTKLRLRIYNDDGSAFLEGKDIQTPGKILDKVRQKHRVQISQINAHFIGAIRLSLSNLSPRLYKQKNGTTLQE